MVKILFVVSVLTQLVVGLNFPKYYTEPIPKKKKGVERIICVGDSVTYGLGVENARNGSYPAHLERILNRESPGDFEVINFGLPGSTIRKDTDYPYWHTRIFNKSLEAEPDIVLLLFGTNDAKDFNWDEDKFRQDYFDIAHEYKDLKPQPKIFIMAPPPANGKFNGVEPELVNNHMLRITQDISHKLGFPDHVIDLFNSMGGTQKRNFPEYYYDYVHPNEAGNIMMAYTIYKHIWDPKEPQKYDDELEAVVAEIAKAKVEMLKELRADYEEQLKRGGEGINQFCSHCMTIL